MNIIATRISETIVELLDTENSSSFCIEISGLALYLLGLELDKKTTMKIVNKIYEYRQVVIVDKKAYTRTIPSSTQFFNLEAESLLSQVEKDIEKMYQDIIRDNLEVE